MCLLLTRLISWVRQANTGDKKKRKGFRPNLDVAIKAAAHWGTKANAIKRQEEYRRQNKRSQNRGRKQRNQNRPRKQKRRNADSEAAPAKAAATYDTADDSGPTRLQRKRMRRHEANADNAEE